MGKSGKKRISFDEYYSTVFESRWPSIREALRRSPRYYPLPTPTPEDENREYYLDEASYRTALQLQPQDGNSVLDMCAAPGGKSLSLLKSFPGIRLTSNEWSSARRARLKRVLEEHLTPAEYSGVKVSGYDARTWFRYEKAAYDYILLDVPCSSERHILNSPKHLQTWSPARSTHLAIQAFIILASALEVIKPGGILLYSTCALSPLENDGVIEKLYKKRPARFELQPACLSFGEKTRYGWQVLPDNSDGRGPMYLALIKRSDT